MTVKCEGAGEGAGAVRIAMEVVGRFRTHRGKCAATGRYGGEIAVSDGGEGDDEEIGGIQVGLRCGGQAAGVRRGGAQGVWGEVGKSSGGLARGRVGEVRGGLVGSLVGSPVALARPRTHSSSSWKPMMPITT